MQLPLEYQNLIKNHALEVAAPIPGALARYLANAQNYLSSARQIDPKLSMQIFTCAYEGYFQMVQAVLEFHQVRAKDAGRNLVIQRVSSDLKVISKNKYAQMTQDFCSAARRKNGRIASYTTVFATQQMDKKTSQMGIFFAGNHLKLHPTSFPSSTKHTPDETPPLTSRRFPRSPKQRPTRLWPYLKSTCRRPTC